MGTKEAYEQYLKEFPEGTWRRQALAGLGICEGIVRNADWAGSFGSRQAIRLFMTFDIDGCRDHIEAPLGSHIVNGQRAQILPDGSIKLF